MLEKQKELMQNKSWQEVEVLEHSVFFPDTQVEFERIKDLLNKSIETNKKRKFNEEMQELFVPSEEDYATIWNILWQAFCGVGILYNAPADEKEMHRKYKELGNGAPLAPDFFTKMLGKPYTSDWTYDGIGWSPLIACINVVMGIATDNRDEITEEIAMCLEYNIKPKEAAWLGGKGVWSDKIIDTIWGGCGGSHEYTHKPVDLVSKDGVYNTLGMGIEIAFLAIRGDPKTLKFLGTQDLGALTSTNAVKYTARLVDRLFDSIGSGKAL